MENQESGEEKSPLTRYGLEEGRRDRAKLTGIKLPKAGGAVNGENRAAPPDR
jgi:hypothetical protein